MPAISDSRRAGALWLVEIIPAVSTTIVKTRQSPENLPSCTATPTKSTARAPGAGGDVASKQWAAVVAGSEVGGRVEGRVLTGCERESAVHRIAGVVHEVLGEGLHLGTGH